MSDSDSINSSSFMPRSYMGGTGSGKKRSQSDPSKANEGPVEDKADSSEETPEHEDHKIDKEQSGDIQADEEDDNSGAPVYARKIDEAEPEKIPEFKDPQCGASKTGDGEQDDEQADIESRSLKGVRIAGIRFGRASKVYHFNAGDMELNAGDWVVVKTEKGMGLGKVAMDIFEDEVSAEHFERLRSIIRKANRDDFEQSARCRAKESEAFVYCCQRIEALELPMKLVGAECFFDQSKYVFYFTADGRVDFRELVKQLVTRFPVRIEMRQIGVRHEAKMIGGLGCCGQELCCSKFLVDFKPVSVRMAKDQNLSLNPGKISGSCGRLMCCLSYEHDTYEQFKRGLPRMGKLLMTEQGEATVVKYNPLEETITLKLEDGTLFDLASEEFCPRRSQRRGERTERGPGKAPGRGKGKRRSPSSGEDPDKQPDEVQ